MRPKVTESDPGEDLFRSRLENLLDQRHELVKLAELIDWEVFDREWSALYEDRRGAPALRTRLVAGLHYLKHLYKLSDEQVVARWVENPYWRVSRTSVGTPVVSCGRWEYGLLESACRGRLQTTSCCYVQKAW